MINAQRMIRTFQEYSAIGSESGDERVFAARVQADLEMLGLATSFDGAGARCGSNTNNLYCAVPGAEGVEPILLGAHMDTVKPGKNVRAVVEGGYVVSGGDTILGGDDKSGIVVILEALRVLKEENIPHRPVEVLLTVCEEVGLMGSRYADLSKVRACCGIVLDSSGTAGDIKIQSPGKCVLIFRVKGKTAHAGACPEAGVSAIMAASDAIAGMRLLRIDEETTANIGSFLAPGASNTVTAYAEVIAEVRSFNEQSLSKQIAHMQERFAEAAAKFGAEVEMEAETAYLPYAIEPEHPLVRIVERACEKEGLNHRTFRDGGGCDANNYFQHGIECVALGNGMERVHTAAERLNIKDFTDAARVLVGILADLCPLKD